MRGPEEWVTVTGVVESPRSTALSGPVALIYQYVCMTAAAPIGIDAHRSRRALDLRPDRKPRRIETPPARPNATETARRTAASPSVETGTSGPSRWPVEGDRVMTVNPRCPGKRVPPSQPIKPRSSSTTPRTLTLPPQSLATAVVSAAWPEQLLLVHCLGTCCRTEQCMFGFGFDIRCAEKSFFRILYGCSPGFAQGPDLLS